MFDGCTNIGWPQVVRLGNLVQRCVRVGQADAFRLQGLADLFRGNPHLLGEPLDGRGSAIRTMACLERTSPGILDMVVQFQHRLERRHTKNTAGKHDYGEQNGGKQFQLPVHGDRSLGLQVAPQQGPVEDQV